MRESNYNKFPATKVQGAITIGWNSICKSLSEAAEGRNILALELYTGTYEEEIISALGQIADRDLQIMPFIVPDKAQRLEKCKKITFF